MKSSFPDNYEKIANDMGIALYQRFSLVEAALFLRCPEKEIEKLISDCELNYIRVTKVEVQFFGFQLLDYLLGKVTDNAPIPTKQPEPDTNFAERIVRAKELVEITGLSRTTIWRMEKTGEFPRRVALGVGSVGWRWSEISEWLQQR